MGKSKKKISRRKFLKISSVSAIFLKITIPLKLDSFAQTQNQNNSYSDLFIQLFADNTILFNLPKHEMGQGVATGLSTIFADELGADYLKITVRQADYNPEFGNVIQGITGGSRSISQCWQPLRQAAAALRELLIQEAAKIWKVNIDECISNNSFVQHEKTKRQVSFGELIPYINNQKLPLKPTLKPKSAFQLIGKPIPNIRTKEIITGQLEYGMDLKIPDMLYAVIARSPVHLGKIESYDDQLAQNVTGVVHIVKIEQSIRLLKENLGMDYEYAVQEGVAVIASNVWAAMKAKKLLKINWSGEKYANIDNQLIQKQLSQDSLAIKTFQNINYGNDDLLKLSGKVITSDYEIGFQAHALMEPLNAIASVKNNYCEVWVATQFAQRFAKETASFLNIPIENVKIHVLPAGGGFGRRWEADYLLEAVILSKKLQKPVKVIWSREDDIQHDFYHSQEILRCKAFLNSNSLMGMDFTRKSFENEYQLNGKTWWNPYSYGLAYYHVNSYRYETPVQVGPWRSVSAHKRAFARECFIDEIAFAVQKDPLEFRLQLLKAPIIIPDIEKDNAPWLVNAEHNRNRIIRILNHVAEKSKLGKNKNQGIAVARYHGDCANVVEVEVIDGKLRIVKVTASVYCGIIINPSQVKAQIEGGIIWALQAVLYGGITINQGKVEQSNFQQYKMVRMNEIPEIEIHLIESDDEPLGAGELGVPAFTPALYNAIFAATGKRYKSIPLNFL
ncbi:MAG: molybdopterin-dependent oxidoreductase [Thermoflexibacter sp.]|nr:molybdopterin-dependent oxidoreductase [Thermoflexibacter sp.]